MRRASAEAGTNALPARRQRGPRRSNEGLEEEDKGEVRTGPWDGKGGSTNGERTQSRGEGGDSGREGKGGRVERHVMTKEKYRQ